MSVHEEHTHTEHGVVVRYGPAADEAQEYPHALAVGNPDSLHVFVGTPAELRAIGQRILAAVPNDDGARPFTVIGYNDANGAIFTEHVRATDEWAAFTAAAEQVEDYPARSAVFVAAIPGVHTATAPADEGAKPCYVADYPAPAKPYIVTSPEGERTWWADDDDHAREQHNDNFSDEPILSVRLAGPDEPLPPTCDEPGCGATQDNPGPSGWDGEHGTCHDHTPA